MDKETTANEAVINGERLTFTKFLGFSFSTETPTKFRRAALRHSPVPQEEVQVVNLRFQVQAGTAQEMAETLSKAVNQVWADQTQAKRDRVRALMGQGASGPNKEA